MLDDIKIDDDDPFDVATAPKPKAPKTVRPNVDYRQLYNDVGAKYGVDPDLLYNQAKHESVGFNPHYVYGPGKSPKGAAGLAQFMPDTARQYGLRVGGGQDDRYNPEKAADAHTRLMKDLIDKYGGDQRLALAAYNSGTNRSAESARRAMQRIPETRNYVQKIAPPESDDPFTAVQQPRVAQTTTQATDDDPFDVATESVLPKGRFGAPDTTAGSRRWIPSRQKGWGKGTIGQGVENVPAQAERQVRQKPQRPITSIADLKRADEQVVDQMYNPEKQGVSTNLPLTNVDPRVLKGEQPSDPMAYAKAQELIGRVEPARSSNPTQEQNEREALERDPSMIAARKRIGSVPEAINPNMPSARGAASAFQRFGGETLKTAASAFELPEAILGGLAQQVGLPAPKVKETLNRYGNILSESASMPLNEKGEAIVRSFPEKATDQLATLGLSLADIIVMKKASGLSLGQIMAITSFAKNSDKPIAQRSAIATEAGMMGKVLDQHLSRPASALAFGAPTAVESGLAYAKGQKSLEDALLETGVQAAAGAALGGKEKPAKGAELSAPEVRDRGTAYRPDGNGEYIFNDKPMPAIRAPKYDPTHNIEFQMDKGGNTELGTPYRMPQKVANDLKADGLDPQEWTYVVAENGDSHVVHDWDIKWPKRAEERNARPTEVPESVGRVPPETSVTPEGTTPAVAQPTSELALPVAAFLEQRLGMPAKTNLIDKTYGTGHHVDFSDGKTSIQTAITETPTTVQLTNIAAKQSEDLKQSAKGTGRGTELVNALKEYADQSGKKLILPDITTEAAPYWEKFSWLKDDPTQTIELQGKTYKPQRLKSYTPERAQVPAVAERAPELAQQPESSTLLYHGRRRAQDTVRAGSMLTSQPEWAAGYTTKVNPSDLSEQFVGKVHEIPFSSANSIEAKTLHDAEQILIDKARTALGREPSSLQEAAETVHKATGADAIIVKKDGVVTDAISLIERPVSGRLEPQDVITRAQKEGVRVPENLLRATEQVPDVVQTTEAKPPAQPEIKPPAETATEVPQESPVEPARAAESPAANLPEAEPPPSTTSARKAQLAQDRADLELPELSQAERRAWKNVLIEAQDEGLDRRANAIADSVLRKPYALSDKDTAGVVLRLQQIKNEHATAMEAVDTAKSDTALVEARQRANDLEAEFDKLSDAVKQSGTEKGRALASQKLTINQDFDPVSMMRRYKVKTGKEPTPEIREQIKTQSKRILELESQLAKAEESGRVKSVADAVAKIDREVRRSRRQESKKALDDEAVMIKSNIAAEFMRLKTQAGKQSTLSSQGLGLLDPDGVITKESIKYVRNRVKSGVTDVAQIIDDVHALIKEFAPEVTRRQIQEAISGYNKLPQSTRSDLQKQIDTLKANMRRELSEVDIEARTRYERGAGPRKSDKDSPLLGPKQGPRMSEKDSPLLGPRQGPRLSEKDSPLLGPKQGPKLSDKDSPLLGPKQGPKLSDKDSPLLGPKQGPKLSEKDSPLLGPRQGPKMSEKDSPLLGPRQGPPRPGVQGPRETKDAIQRRYQKQISEIERKIREQDFAPKTQRGPTVLDADTQKIKVNLERAKQDFQRKLREWEYSQRSKSEKVADLAVNWSRAAKLMYVSTLGKLGSAATGRIVMSPIENMVGEIPHRLMPKLSAKAPTEGGGFSKAAEVAALWKSGRFRQVLDYLTKGSSDLDVLLGSRKSMDKEMNSGGLLGIPGRVHGAMKEYPRQAEYDRAFVKVLKNYERSGKDITRPDVQLAARMEAFNSADRARFQQRNFLSDGFNDLMSKWERKGGAAKGAAKIGRFVFPITRVPVNVVGETLNYTFGLPRAAAEHAWRTMRGTMEQMTPEQADNLMRAYKKGGVGLAVMTYAFLNPNQFGGYYQKGDKRKDEEVQPGEIMFFGKRIPKVFTHVPILEAAQFAATARRVMDKMIEKGDEGGKTGAIAEGGLAATKGLAEEVPFYETPARWFTGKEGSRGVAEGAGELARGTIPGFIQETAKYTDKDAQGNPIPRAPQGGFPSRFGQTIEMGVPGLRQRVPVKDKAVKDARNSQLVTDFHDRKVTRDDLSTLRDQDVLTPEEAGYYTKNKKGEETYHPGTIEKKAEMLNLPSYVADFEKLRYDDQALSRYENLYKQKDPRVSELKDSMSRKAWNLVHSGNHTQAEKDDFQSRLDKLGITPVDPKKKKSSDWKDLFKNQFQEK
jgi:hypothetical protein